MIVKRMGLTGDWRVDGKPDYCWVSETFEIETAVRCHAISGVYINLRVAGKCADWVLLSDDQFTIALGKVKGVRAVCTVVGGWNAWRAL